ncbi:hypothetical protein GBO97_09920 [Pediococcus acidilactici]|uniref:hypothetical protein n=1 Tax=Pediococcus acidilactici TaxID=1254 RepID=UPI001330418E|nr:hypothetical protein [Pediococcus acidilactici]KAF0352739.1 hypothetical protein GBO47_09620 [Pediococcus acidilactici]KAF0356947.1 hypothetical protein GBO51_09960 [Pediococcus acidilactici]KAF0445786.1 hypothetical protein GBO97_09920 [Pediococcus acidilactici]
MKNVYVIRQGDLYYKEREVVIFGGCRYTMTDSLNDASFGKNFDGMKKRAEKIGGKVYRVILEEVKS